jgi:hypothetical protein
MSRQLDELSLQLGLELVRPSQEMADYALILSGRPRLRAQILRISYIRLTDRCNS